MTDTTIDALLGHTLTAIDGAAIGSEEIRFSATDNRRWRMYHWPDCCENVEVAEVIGDVDDLIGSPILRAEEASSPYRPCDRYDDAGTWTFYKLATIKGEVVLRWLGTSNGYYSERVDFEEITQ